MVPFPQEILKAHRNHSILQKQSPLINTRASSTKTHQEKGT
jgi:hypothetical protein